MGEILQIRVNAKTFTLETARKRCPALFSLADQDNSVLKLPTIIKNLHALLQFGDINKEHNRHLDPGWRSTWSLRNNWSNPADHVSNRLREKLDNLEKIRPFDDRANIKKAGEKTWQAA